MRYSSIVFVCFLWMSGLYSCRARDCNSIPQTFSSYSEALARIKSSSFALMDSVTIENNSLMIAAKYLSCDRRVGYFIFTRDGGSEFFSSNIPLEVWMEFKKADLKDSFYYKNIRDKYTGINIEVDLDKLSK